jgi:hypothetical protein
MTSKVPVVPKLVPITLEDLSRPLDAQEPFVPPLPSFPLEPFAPEVLVAFLITIMLMIKYEFLRNFWFNKR